MTAADSLYQTFGALQFPASVDSESGTLTSLDPARDQLLDFFKTAINSELTTAWQAVTDNPLGAAATAPVMDTYPGEPVQQAMTQRKGGWPLLALHRDGAGTFSDYTLERRRLTQNWKLHYILGPLDVIGERKIKDICVAIPKLLDLVIRERRHRSYQSGELQFFADTSGLAAVDLVSFETGQAVFAGGDESSTRFVACEMTLATIEYSGYVAGSEESDLTGLDIAVGVGDESEILPDAILAST